MRLFVSIPLPDEARHGLAQATRGMRTTRPDQWHLTLAFIAEHDDPDGLAQDLAEAVAGHPPLTLHLEGGGSFVGVVWAGVSGDVTALKGLAATVQRACGRAVDRKPFRPHVTVARRGDPSRLRDYCGPSWDVESVDLVHSVLGPGPVEHAVLHRLPLG